MSNKSLSDLSAMPFNDLRKLAISYGVQLRRDMKAHDIAKEIYEAQNGPITTPQSIGDDPGRPAKGWARIELQKDPSPGASNTPVFLGCNGYQVRIHRGTKVDVPIKILRGPLMDAKTTVMRENQNEVDIEKRYYWEEVYVYPFIVHDINEGPDPRNTYETAAFKKSKYRRQFHEERGYWPRAQEVRDYMTELSKSK